MDHTIRAFDVDLSELARKVVEMGRLVKQQIEDATEAMRRHDIAFAEQVAAADRRLDAAQRKIEDLAVTTIARRQPVAVDLRELVGAMRMSADLERIGDFAKNIAKRVAALSNNFHIDGVMPQLELMVQQVINQLSCVLESYERRDVSKALEVWRKDQDIDALNNSLFRTLLTHMMEDPAAFRHAPTFYSAPRISSEWAITLPTSRRPSTTSSRDMRSKRSARKRTLPARMSCA